MSQSRKDNTEISKNGNTSQYRYNFKKHDEELIEYKNQTQDDQKIVEGFYHPKAFDPSLTQAIENHTLFKKPAPTRLDSIDSFKASEVPNKKGYRKK